MRTRMLISSVKFRMATIPLQAMGKMPAATAPRASHRKG